MSKIVLIEDLFDASAARVIPHEGPILNYLLEKYPTGFGGRTARIFVNNVELPVIDYDTPIAGDDICTIVMPPNDPVTAAFVAVAAGTATATQVVIVVLTNIALSLVTSIITSLFMPKPKSQSAAKRVYEIGAQQNQPALGEVVPEHFGSLWFLPSYASQPYVRYEKGDQYLYQIMLAGAGTMELEDLRIGSSKADSFQTGMIEYHWLTPDIHGGVLGYIESTYGIHEDVVSSPEVQNIDLGRSSTDTFFGRAYAGNNYYEGKESNPDFKIGDTVTVKGEFPYMNNHNTVSTITVAGQKIRLATAVANDGGNPAYQLIKTDDSWRGWFEVCAPTKVTNKLELDFVFPNGLYIADDDGDYRRRSCYINVEYQQIDATGATIGSVVAKQFIYSAASNNVKRITETLLVASGRYRIRCSREDRDDAKSAQQSRVQWTGLRAYCVYAAGTPAYGDVTLLVMKMKAGPKLSDSATGKITCKASRKLHTVPSNFNSFEITKNPVDAFAFIVRSGANDPDGLDMGSLQTIHAKWVNTNGFNYRFEDQSTVFEALQLVAASHRATPQAYAKQLSMRLDRAKPYDQFLITNEQMLQGSYSLGIRLGNDSVVDGYRIEYQDPLSTARLFVVWPYEASNPESVRLYGCTSSNHALQQAKYLWAKRDAMRRIVEFETEFDAHCYSIGDRIAVMHPLVEWTSNARVLQATGLVLTLDGLPESQGPVTVKLRSDTGTPSQLITGNLAGNKLTLEASPPFPIYDVFSGREPTTVIMGTEANFRRSYVVQEINPSSDSISVKAVGYDDAPYAFAIPEEL